MNSLLDIGIISAIFSALAIFFTKIGSDIRKEAQEKRRDLWAHTPIIEDIIIKYKFQETYPAVAKIVEFYDNVRNGIREIKPKDLLDVPQYLDEIKLRIKNLIEDAHDDDSKMATIIDIIDFFDWIRNKEKRLKLEEIPFDSSNIEDLENRLRKLKKAFEEEEEIKKIHQNLADYSEYAGWLILFTAFFSVLGIFLVGILPIYLSIHLLFFWIIELILLIIPLISAIIKYKKSKQYEKQFLNYKMQFSKSILNYKKSRSED